MAEPWSNQDIKDKVASGAQSALIGIDEAANKVGRLFGTQRSVAETNYKNELAAAKKAKQDAKDASEKAEGDRLQKLLDEDKSIETSRGKISTLSMR